MRPYLLLFSALLAFFLVNGQVKTNFNNYTPYAEKGKFTKAYRSQIDFQLAAKNIKTLIEKEKSESGNEASEKPFRFAEPTPVDLDIAARMNWTTESDYAFGRFAIKANEALSTSINFDRFYLPPGTEMYIYNENGNMITGPITMNENNPNKVWGSWVYKGSFLTVEVKTPLHTKDQLLLHANNIAYGYKEIYKTQVGDFGQSAHCEINVICPLGTGWEAERNAVALVLNDVGSSWCSGAMIMNTCNSYRPFF